MLSVLQPTERMQSHTGYIFLLQFLCTVCFQMPALHDYNILHLFDFLPLCFFSNVFSNCLPEEMHSHTGSIHQICLCCVFSNVFQNGLCVFEGFLKTLPNQDAKSKWLHLFDFSPVYVFNCVPKGCKVTLFVFVSFSEKSGFQVEAGTEQSTMKGTSMTYMSIAVHQLLLRDDQGSDSTT